MYGHEPEGLWKLPTVLPDLLLVPAGTGPGVLVMKRFENNTSNPLGAHFVGERPGFDRMAQAYASPIDLSAPLFEATFRALRGSEYPVWKDYVPAPGWIDGPPGVEEYRVLHGVLEALEVDTFRREGHLDEAARAELACVVYAPDGVETSRFNLSAQVRIRRGAGDVLDALGQRLAQALSERIRGGL